MGSILEAHLHNLIAYFSAHPKFALAAIFAGAALEAFAFIGTVIPGSTIVFVGGVLIGLNAIHAWPAALAALSGAIVGDGFSYWLGHHYRERLLSMWPMKRYPALFEKGHAYFASKGGKSVFLGRFLGPLRAIVPVVAGMSGMPARPFYTMNVASAFAWAAAHMLPGVLFGATLQIAGAISSRLLILLVVLAIVVWLLVRLLRLLFFWGLPRLATLRDHLVGRAQRGTGPLARLLLFLLDPRRPGSQARFIATLLIVGGAWLFLGVLQDVLSNDPLVRFDHSVNTLFQGLRTEWGDQAMVRVTEVGGPAGTIALVVCLAGYFAYKRYWQTLTYWLATAGLAELLVWAFKTSVERVRPNNFYTGMEQFSFPSGHTTLSIVIYGLLAFLLGIGKSARQKTVVTLMAAVLISLVAFSRIYLGVHWFSDIVASLSVGLMLVALTGIAYMLRVRNEPIAALPISLLVVGALSLVALVYPSSQHEKDMLRCTYAHRTSATLLDNWTQGGWRQLPAARTDLEGDREGLFSAQWAGTAAEITSTLTAAGWRIAPPWTIKSTLLWLLPKTPIEQLPVLPKLNHGQAPEMTFVKIVNPRERLVFRLWITPYVVRPTSPAASRPLWLGMPSAEVFYTMRGMFLYEISPSDPSQTDKTLRSDLQQPGLANRSLQDGGKIMLVW